ncbi:MAG: beta strand repeat-containing protein [Tenuifilaceae bacterium]
MKRNLLYTASILAVLFFSNFQANAQVAINTDGSAPNSSSMLDVVSITRGFLAPRMTLAQRNGIGSPATGLLIYQTDNTPGFYYYNGLTWTILGGSETDPIVRAINGIVKSNGTTISAASSGIDYSAGTSSLATGIVKSTTGTGALSIAVAGDFPILNQNTTGTAANVTGVVAVANGGTGSSTQNFVDLTTGQTVGGAKIWSNLGTFNAGITSIGAAINLNSSSNFATNINNGTSNAAVNIANGTIGGNIISIGNTVGTTGITQRVGTGNFSLDGVAGSIYSIGPSTVGGTITIGGTAQTGAIGIGTGTGAQTINIGTGGTGIKSIRIGTGAIANSILIGNTTAGTRTGINVATSTAQFHLGPGNAAVNNAPLKFTSGANLTAPESGAVEFDGTNYYATSGTTRYTLAKTLTATATLNFPNTLTNRSSDLPITVTGAVSGDVVILGVPNGSVSANTCYTCWVSANNTVTVRFNNYSAAGINPASGTFRVTVLKY